MIRLILIVATFFVAASYSSFAQAPADTAGIIRAALDYAEGWYAGDGKQMEKALHPELAKRVIRNDEQGRSQIDQMSALTLIQATRKGWGKQVPAERRQKDVTVLTIFGNIASVKVEMEGWVDFMHIGKYSGEWKIVNVLWDEKPRR
jgi:hypothetical protein